jgi:hypothetical protein
VSDPPAPMESSSPAESGTDGVRPKVPEATTTLPHRNEGLTVATR